MHLWLGYLLDDLEGATAALLRRQRYQHRCSEYEYLHFQRLLYGWHCDWYDGLTRNVVGDEMDDALSHKTRGAFGARFMAGLKYHREALGDVWMFGSTQTRASCSLFIGPEAGPDPWEIKYPPGMPRRSPDPEHYCSCTTQVETETMTTMRTMERMTKPKARKRTVGVPRVACWSNLVEETTRIATATGRYPFSCVRTV